MEIYVILFSVDVRIDHEHYANRHTFDQYKMALTSYVFCEQVNF